MRLVSDTAVLVEERERPSPLSRCTAFFVYMFERLIPDPYVFAVILTFVGVLLAFSLAPNGAPKNILSSWYGGVFGILTFAFQMVMMLVTGYALASAPSIATTLAKIASIPKDAKAAVSLTVVVAMIASWLNWGLGLVVSALLAREIAKRVKVDFGWLVAAAYTGFVVSTEGLSGSIALSQATHGSALNIVEKVTGRMTPLSQTVFTRFNLIPVLVLFLVLPFVFRYLGPPADTVKIADPERLVAEDQLQKGKEKAGTLGSKLDHAWILNLLLVAFGASALGIQWSRNGFSLDLNSVIMTLFLAGLLLHWTPTAYVSAIQRASPGYGIAHPAVSLVRRADGHYDGNRLGRSARQGFPAILDRAHAAVLDLPHISNHHFVRSQRRRSLGGTGAVRGPGRPRSPCLACWDHHGSCDGRIRRQHAAALLGSTHPRHRRYSDAAHDGLHGHHVCHIARRLRNLAACPCPARLAQVRTETLDQSSRAAKDKALLSRTRQLAMMGGSLRSQEYESYWASFLVLTFSPPDEPLLTGRDLVHLPPFSA